MRTAWLPLAALLACTQTSKAPEANTSEANAPDGSASAGNVTAGSATGRTVGSATAPDPEQREVEAWRARRLGALTSETGWLSLAGLHWLKEGAQTAGSAEGNDLRLLERAPGKLGVFELRAGKVRFAPDPAAAVMLEGKPAGPLELESDAAGKPTTLSSGTFSFFLIKRGERFAIRLRDRESKARRGFHGIEAYPVDARYRVTARWEPLAQPQKIPIPTILGTIEPMESPGVAVFQLEGRELRLQPVIEEGEKNLFFIFQDATTGSETYGAGRFLYAKPASDGKVVLDFNQSYNPPCAFTPYATCPLPPEQNKLAVAIRAGEKKYGNH